MTARSDGFTGTARSASPRRWGWRWLATLALVIGLGWGGAAWWRRAERERPGSPSDSGVLTPDQDPTVGIELAPLQEQFDSTGLVTDELLAATRSLYRRTRSPVSDGVQDRRPDAVECFWKRLLQQQDFVRRAQLAEVSHRALALVTEERYGQALQAVASARPGFPSDGTDSLLFLDDLEELVADRVRRAADQTLAELEFLRRGADSATRQARAERALESFRGTPHEATIAAYAEDLRESRN